jgi:hypothetical protein
MIKALHEVCEVASSLVSSDLPGRRTIGRRSYVVHGEICGSLPGRIAHETNSAAPSKAGEWQQNRVKRAQGAVHDD